MAAGSWAAITGERLSAWVVLDTFDMFSPEHDHPEHVRRVAEIFRKAGAEVTFAGYVGEQRAVVVRAVVVRAVRP